MAQYYTLSDIFEHEDTTRQYCLSEDGANLSTPTLIYLASLEPDFDTNYAEYLIFKRLHQVAGYIARESKKKGYQINVIHNQNLKEDLENNNSSEDYYKDWYQRYDDPLFCPEQENIYQIIDQAVRDNNWNFLYYLYYKEENELYDLLTNYKNNIKERKFFIVQ